MAHFASVCCFVHDFNGYRTQRSLLSKPNTEIKTCLVFYLLYSFFRGRFALYGDIAHNLSE